MSVLITKNITKDEDTMVMWWNGWCFWGIGGANMV